MMPAIERLWPYVVLLSTGAVGVVALGAVPVPLPVRTALGLWFILVCPGMALVRPLRLDNPLNEWMLAVVLSVSLATIVASVFLYAAAWSWPHILLVLMTVSSAGALVDLGRAIRPAGEASAQ